LGAEEVKQSSATGPQAEIQTNPLPAGRWP
jgi:hypothetical protein